MPTESFGHYMAERAARQLICNGGWDAFAAVPMRGCEPQDDAPAVFPMHRMIERTVFASEAAAIAGAREVAFACLRSGNPQQ